MRVVGRLRIRNLVAGLILVPVLYNLSWYLWLPTDLTPIPQPTNDTPLVTKPPGNQMPQWKTSKDQLLSRLKYWEYTPDIPEPTPMELSPFPDHKAKFLTFQPDHGGWNNIRMQFESIVVFAKATNRILVMPPRQKLYLLEHTTSLEDFYDLTELKDQMTIISCRQFCSLLQVTDSEASSKCSDAESFFGWLRSVAADSKAPFEVVMPKFTMWKEVLALPDIETCRKARYPPEELARIPDFSTFLDDKVARELEDRQVKSQVLHIASDAVLDYRFFGLWYSFFYFADHTWYTYLVALIQKRLHYKEYLFDLSAEIVANIHETSGYYGALHVRRGDFQYKQTRLSCEDILSNIEPLLKANGIKNLYIATDEKDLEFFNPFKEKNYTLFFLKDFPEQANKVNSNFLGMLDQIVCASAKLFIGTELSTFSSHITRLRYQISPELVENKEFYLTTRNYFGNAEQDSWETKATWFGIGNLRWRHATYFREFFQFLKI